jgi:hypothetical protein
MPDDLYRGGLYIGSLRLGVEAQIQPAPGGFVGVITLTRGLDHWTSPPVMLEARGPAEARAELHAQVMALLHYLDPSKRPPEDGDDGD